MLLVALWRCETILKFVAHLFGVFTEKLVAPLPCKSTLKHIVYLPLGITGELGMPKIDFRNSPSNSPARELVLRARLPTPPRAQPKKTAALTHSRLPSPPRAPPRRTTAPAFASTSSKARQKSKVGTKEKEHKPAIRKEASREIKSEASATKPGAPPRRAAAFAYSSLPTPPKAPPKRTTATTAFAQSRLPTPPKAPPKRTTALKEQKSKVDTVKEELEPVTHKEASRRVKFVAEVSESKRTKYNVMTAEEMRAIWPENDWRPPTPGNDENTYYSAKLPKAADKAKTVKLPKAADKEKSAPALRNTSGGLQLLARWVPNGDEDLLCVICDDDKEPPFQDAFALLQTMFNIEKGWNSIEISESWQRDSSGAATELEVGIGEVDKAFGEDPRCFGIATLLEGDAAGMRAIGLGSNRKRIQRSAAIALVLTALSSPSFISARDCCKELKDLWDAFQAAAPAAVCSPASSTPASSSRAAAFSTGTSFSSRATVSSTGAAAFVSHGPHIMPMELYFAKAWRSTLLEKKLQRKIISIDEFFAQHPDGKKAAVRPNTGHPFELGQFVVVFGEKQCDALFDGAAALIVAFELSGGGRPLFTIALLGRHFGSYFCKTSPSIMRACDSKTTWDLMMKEDPALLKDLTGIEFG